MPSRTHLSVGQMTGVSRALKKLQVNSTESPEPTGMAGSYISMGGSVRQSSNQLEPVS